MTAPSPRMPAKSTSGPVPSMLAAAGVAVLLNGGLVLWDQKIFSADSSPAARFAPPGWLVGGVWIVLFALLGLARWRLLQARSLAGREAARWTMVFIGVCAVYPVYTVGLRSLAAGFFGNIGTAIFAIVLGLRVRRVDQGSAGVYALVVGWLCYATLAVAEELGWLPF